MTLRDPSGGHDRNVCRAKKHNKQRPGAKTGKNPLHDAEGNELCTRPAGWGTDHPGHGPCKLHGGNTTSHVTAGVVAMAESAVKTFGLSREIDPRDALLEEVYRTAGAVDWLAKQVQALDTASVVWGRTEETDEGVKHKAAPNVWVQLYQQERAHLVRVAKEAIAAGIEERKVRLAEQQGAMLASVIKAVLADLDLTADQQARVPEVVPRHLRAVG
jgi:hypothetical protein